MAVGSADTGERANHQRYSEVATAKASELRAAEARFLSRPAKNSFIECTI